MRRTVFGALREQGVVLEGVLLRPDMVVPGKTLRARIGAGGGYPHSPLLPWARPGGCAGGLCSFLVVRRNPLETSPYEHNQPATGCTNPGQSASPMGAHFKIRRWKRGTVRLRI